MMRVQLVVTGECEARGLHHSLRALFADADLEFARPVKVDSFTSTPLTDPIPRGVVDTIDKFARKLVEKVDEENDTMVIGVDDLELHGAPDLAASAVRKAVERSLEHEAFASSDSKRLRLREQVSARCSFHLLVPMVEAYFFGEPGALIRAGATRTSCFDPTLRDVEDFLVADPEFAATHSRHPKRYLQFLSNDTYRETRAGVAALSALDWTLVLGNEVFVRSARALVADIADFVARPAIPGVELSETSRGTQRATRVLRNL